MGLSKQPTILSTNVMENEPVGVCMFAMRVIVVIDVIDVIGVIGVIGVIRVDLSFAGLNSNEATCINENS